jgi:Copper type II ascorbate-dependent monooxygenase, C-terminal domain
MDTDSIRPYDPMAANFCSALYEDISQKGNHTMQSKTTLATLCMAAGLLATTSVGCSSATGAVQSLPPDAGAGPAKTFEELIAYDWTIDPGVEAYYCVYQTLAQDVWVSDYRALAPAGTHHVTVGYGDPGPPDGVVSSADSSACTGLTLGTNMAFTATRGNATPFSMPAGVAVRVAAGKQLLLNVHVLNATQQALSGRTGIEVVRADPAKVQHQAEMLFANNVNLSIPPGPSTQTGKCTLDADSTIFALFGHMHLAGKHLTTTIMPANGVHSVLLDEDYNFDEQKLVSLDPPAILNKGDVVQTSCTYQNPGPDTLAFGESTTKNEMCISIMYRYPAVASSFNCAQ